MSYLLEYFIFEFYTHKQHSLLFKDYYLYIIF